MCRFFKPCTLAHCGVLEVLFILPQVDLVWNFVGSTGGLLIVYILPPLYYLRIRFLHLRFRRQQGESFRNVRCCNNSLAWKIKDVIALAILCLGMVSMIASNYHAIRAIVDAGGQQPTPPCLYWVNVAPLNITNTTNITGLTAVY